MSAGADATRARALADWLDAQLFEIGPNGTDEEKAAFYDTMFSKMDEWFVLLRRLAAAPANDDALALARILVGGDGASEDGCVACGVGYVGDEGFLRHAADCPIATYRLRRIGELVANDPAADSTLGRELRNLAATQWDYEEATLPALGRARPEGST